MLVKLTDPSKIAWDSETGTVITGKGTFEVPFSPFIRSKLLEGALVEVKEEVEKVKPGKKETSIDVKTDVKPKIDDLPMAELRKLASEKGINSFGMKKVDLIEALKGV